MKFLLHCGEDVFRLDMEGVDEPHEFTTLLNALTFANNVSEDGESPLTVVDSRGRLIDESFVGREHW